MIMTDSAKKKYYENYVSAKEKADNDKLESDLESIVTEMNIETLNLLHNFMQPEDICFVLENVGNDAKTIQS